MIEHSTQPVGIKAAVSAVIQSLPDDVSWDEVHYHLYVRQQIESGLMDSDTGRLIDTDEMRQRLKARKNEDANK